MSSNSAWPPEPLPSSSSVGYLSRKALPIKRNDAEALTREDVQFDLLHHIFADDKAVFTSHHGSKTTKQTFNSLYVNALYRSNKCSKVLKEKMMETPAFGIELAKISLLTNVGRINTTMAFFPEMKTALRTYHPVPSLQKTDGNAQDAPRIKNCLKAALLPAETKTVPPSTPEEILKKSASGMCPPTSVVNLIFVLANHAGPLATVHFDGTMNFLDLFLPKPLSSSDRARAFLWHIYRYLEPPGSTNPFDDDFSRRYPGKAPLIKRLTKADYELENVDTQEEIEWGHKMSTQRNTFLQKLVSSAETEKKPRAPYFVPGFSVTLSRCIRIDFIMTSDTPDASASTSVSSRSRPQRRETSREEGQFMFYIPGQESSPPRDPEPGPSKEQECQTTEPDAAPPLQPRRTGGEPRSMLQQAWHSITNNDPLLDSDEENPDEHVRLEFTRRLDVLTRMRGRPPTPENIQATGTQGSRDALAQNSDPTSPSSQNRRWRHYHTGSWE